MIDVPFSPHESNANRLITRRGRGDGIYVVDPGNVPLPPELLAEERAAVGEGRVAADNRLFQSLVHDINLMSV